MDGGSRDIHRAPDGAGAHTSRRVPGRFGFAIAPFYPFAREFLSNKQRSAALSRRGFTDSHSWPAAKFFLRDAVG